MKNYLLLLFAFFALFACRDDEFGGGNGALKPIDFSISVNYDPSFNALASSGATVVMTNTTTGDVYTKTTENTGQANFTQILPGNYTVTINKKMTSAEFSTLFGYVPQEVEVVFNATQENVKVSENVTSTALVLKAGRVGDLVIKQIYYAGSHTRQGASFRDQFIEIYNNSNETIYADGLYIAQTYGKTNTTTNEYTLPSGQFDWSKSLKMTAGNAANTDYVYADYVIQIPGLGATYPIAPGQSFVIAATGVNHKAPLVDNQGDPLTVDNPELTIDLSTAEFEVYLGDFRTSIGEAVFRSDIQNPSVMDVVIAYWGIPGYYSGNRDLLMDNLGRDSFVLFRADNFDSFGAYTDPTILTVTSNSNYFKQIPQSIIIDGVELQHYNPNSQRPKHLSASIDAGSIHTDAAYNSQSVIRKVKTTLSDGRKVLEDSNNSSNDFVIMQKAAPKEFAP